MAIPKFFFGENNMWAFLKAWQYLRNGYQASSYPNGAVKPPYDYSIDNGCPAYADRADGNSALQVAILADANNVTQLSNPHGVNIQGGAAVLGVGTPSAPTVTPLGAVGSTSYSYVIVARSGQGETLGTSAGSSTGSTTTGNATLSATNYNQLSIPVPAGAKSVDIYRSVGGSTQGRISTIPVLLNALGTVQNAVIGSGTPVPVSQAGNGTQSTAGTLLFNDTGQTGDGTTAPTVSSSGILQSPFFGDINVVALTTPVNVVATPQGTAGSTSISYKVTALSQSGHTAASSAGSTTTANATLSATNSVIVTFNSVPGALSYNIYRTSTNGTSPTTTGLIGNVPASSEGTTLSFLDTGLAGDSSTAPTTNTTGGITSAGGVSGVGGANFLATENGANNAIATPAGGPALATGLIVYVQLAHTLQAGANTFAYSGGSALAIKSHFNTANNIATAYAATGIIGLIYNGTLWLDLSE
jgi:hypothetical protein